MRTITLQATTPRDEKTAKAAINVRTGLVPSMFVGWIFLVSGIWMVPILTLVISTKEQVAPGMLAMLAMSMVEGAMGFWLIRRARHIKRQRLRALTHGTLESAVVVAHHIRVGLAIVISRLDTKVELEVSPKIGSRFLGSFRSPTGGWRERLPLGAETQALVDTKTGAVLFPAAFDAEVVLVD